MLKPRGSYSNRGVVHRTQIPASLPGISSGAPERTSHYVPQWLEDLAGHQDKYVRANAAQLLSRHKSDPVVQAVLGKALKNPSTQVRAAASGVQRPYLR